MTAPTADTTRDDAGYVTCRIHPDAPTRAPREDFPGQRQRLCTTCGGEVCQLCGGPKSSWMTGVCDSCYRVTARAEDERRREDLRDSGRLEVCMRILPELRAVRDEWGPTLADSDRDTPAGHAYLRLCATIRALED